MRSEGHLSPPDYKWLSNAGVGIYLRNSSGDRTVNPGSGAGPVQNLSVWMQGEFQKVGDGYDCKHEEKKCAAA